MAFECLKKMYKDELYTNVLYLGNLVMTTMDRCPDFLSPLNRYQACIYYADAFLNLKSPKRAEQIYMRALSIRKSATTPIGSKRSSTNNGDYTAEDEVKFRLHICLIRQNKLKEAVGVLESIAAKNRTPKVNSSLGQLYKRLNLTQPAVQAYKDLLAACPYSFEAILALLDSDVSQDDIRRIIDQHPEATEMMQDMGDAGWFDMWFNGQASFSRRDYAAATASFNQLDTNTSLANNPMVLSHLATSHYSNGDYGKACTILQRVHSLDPLHVQNMDILASLLAQEKRGKELESLSTRLMTASPECRQSWVAMGYLCRFLKKLPKSLYFAHKASGDARPRSYVEGMLLKGLVLMDLKKYAEASMHFLEALVNYPHRFELYEGLVNCHLERNKLKEARAAAALCVKQTGQTARSLTLYATVLVREPATLGEAQTLLERALAAAPSPDALGTGAVALLVSIYDRRRLYDKAVDLLRRQTAVCVNSKLHSLLGEVLGKSTMHAQSLDSYRFALTLDPSDPLSLAGLNEFSGETSSASSGSGLGLLNLATSGSAAAATSSSTASTNTAAMTTPDPIASTSDAAVLAPNAPVRPLRTAAATEASPAPIDVNLPTILDYDMIMD